ncbi:MAG: transcriptional regulator [Thermoproteota archaeon]|nr:transcriptional regulator [Thermoproteota archaeon]
MRKSKPTGIIVLVISILAFSGYAYVLLATEWGVMAMEITVLIIVGTLATIMAWIGYTMATAPKES